MSGLNLVMPMAGRGSRFAKAGIREPKPLIDLDGRPFFWWAVESVRRVARVERMVCVILAEHIAQWRLDERIREFYPDAEMVVLADVTSGSAESAMRGVERLDGTGAVAINDCDHAFVATGLDAAVAGWDARVAGMLVTFPSKSANYGFVELSADGAVTGTVEKQAVSPYAIAGCYLFRDARLYMEQYEAYAQNCPYPELYISGMYNQLLDETMSVETMLLEDHFAFGTPEEYVEVQLRMINRLADWR